MGQPLLDPEEFIARQAAFQFGSCSAPLNLDLADVVTREAEGRLSLALHDFEHASFVPAERGIGLVKNGAGLWRTQFGDTAVPSGHKLKASRKASILSDLYGFGLSASVILDMNDAVWRANAFPTFQYNRVSGAPNAILWPLRRVHQIGRTDFCSLPDPLEVPLDRKKPCLVWRGSLRGFSTYEGKRRSITGLVRWHLQGRIGKKELLRHLATVPRYMFVSRYFGAEGFDAGFTAMRDRPYMSKVPEIARFEKERLAPSEQLACKYLISIQGTDVGSSFGWQLGTNGVILKESYAWEVFFDCHFRPWEHFVPVEPGFTDVEEKIAWCEANPDACKAQIARRHALVPLLLDEELRNEALRRVVARYNEFYAGWRSANSTAAE